MYISEMGNVKHFQVVSSSPQWKKEGSSQTDLNWHLDFWRINGEAVNLAVMSEQGHHCHLPVGKQAELTVYMTDCIESL